MTEEARRAKLQTLEELLAHDLTGAEWTKSTFSGGGSGDCLEVTHVPEKGGWVLRHSVLTHIVMPLTEAEYRAYCDGVKANQTGLVPGA